MYLLSGFVRVALRVIRRFLLFFVLVGIRERFRPFPKIWGHADGKENVEFVPFGTPACHSLHQVIASAVEKSGIPANVRFRGLNDVEAPECGGASDGQNFQFETFSQLVDFLEDLGKGSPRMARGIIDSFIRICSPNVFFGDFRVDNLFVEHITKTVSRAEAIVSASSGIVLADSAYVENCAVVVEAERQSKPCWVLQPEGRFFRAFSGVDEENLALNASKVSELIASDRELVRKAEQYSDKRFSGLAARDYDAKAAFRGRDRIDRQSEKKKVLFLHAFRDANLIPLRTAEGAHATLFRTYFEWTDFAFSVIAESPNDWLIRPHPLSKAFPSDTEILNFLVDKHSLQSVPLVADLSTTAVLRSKLPVFTHSGTIALETATFGYKSVVCSQKFPSEVVVQPSSREDLKVLMKSEDYRTVRPELSADDSALAKTLLYLKSKTNRIELGTHEPAPNPTKPLWREVELGIQLFELLRTLRSQRALGSVERIASEIVEAVSQESSNL